LAIKNPGQTPDFNPGDKRPTSNLAGRVGQTYTQAKPTPGAIAQSFEK